MKDLTNANSLDQIKWIFNGRKIDKLPQKDFIKALESSKEKLFNSKAKQLFEKEFRETFLDADDLIQALYKNEDWFKKVFQRVNLK